MFPYFLQFQVGFWIWDLFGMNWTEWIDSVFHVAQWFSLCPPVLSWFGKTMVYMNPKQPSFQVSNGEITRLFSVTAISVTKTRPFVTFIETWPFRLVSKGSENTHQLSYSIELSCRNPIVNHARIWGHHSLCESIHPPKIQVTPGCTPNLTRDRDPLVKIESQSLVLTLTAGGASQPIQLKALDT